MQFRSICGDLEEYVNLQQEFIQSIINRPKVKVENFGEDNSYEPDVA
jgi:hypothetical protein